MKGFYSVFNPRGEKIADCGIERDAVNLIGMRNRRWDGHYYQFTLFLETLLMFPTNKITTKEVEYIEVGGQTISIQQLPPK